MQWRKNETTQLPPVPKGNSENFEALNSTVYRLITGTDGTGENRIFSRIRIQEIRAIGVPIVVYHSLITQKSVY